MKYLILLCLYIRQCKENLTLYSHLQKWLVYLILQTTKSSSFIFKYLFLNYEKENIFFGSKLGRGSLLVGHFIGLFFVVTVIGEVGITDV